MAYFSLAGMFIAAPAAAGPPSHPSLPDPIGGFVLNKACGAAVDPLGNIYAASAGSDSVEIFDSTGSHIFSLANPNDPCGLAVDSDGTLYVSEHATGEVAKYEPTSFPFAGPPAYGPRLSVDSSGDAVGIAVDPSDDRLYVARGADIATYDSAGKLGIDEIQRILPFGTSGAYSLTFEGESTTPLPVGATHAEVQAALESLSSIGSGNVAVSQGPNPDPKDHLVTFVGALASTDVAPLVPDFSQLSGGFAETEPPRRSGFSGLIGEGVFSDATGVAADHADDESLYVFGADASSEEILVFSGKSVSSLGLRRRIDGSDKDAFTADKTPANRLGFGVDAALAVDGANGHVLVYDADDEVVDEFEATGAYVTQVASSELADAEPTGIAVHPAIDEVQRLTVVATGGTYTLSFEGETTGPLDFDATPQEVEAALTALAAIGPDDVAVHRYQSDPYFIAFAESLGESNVDELEGDGAGLTGAGSSIQVATEVEGSGPGRLYVSVGAAAGGKVLAFGPLSDPSRSRREGPHSLVRPNANSVAVDAHGNRYVGADARIYVYPPASDTPLVEIADPGRPYDLAVDSDCNLYALNKNTSFLSESVVYYAPSSCPPKAGSGYGPPVTVAENALSPFSGRAPIRAIGLNPADDHLFVSRRDGGGNPGQIIELESVAEGSDVVDPDWAPFLDSVGEIEGCGASGEMYVSRLASAGREISVVGQGVGGAEVLVGTIKGTGSPRGRFLPNTTFGIDHRNCHVVTFTTARETAEEYETSATFLAGFGAFTDVFREYRVAVDSSSSPAAGSAYVAYDEAAPGTFDVTAFGPLSYSGPPEASTGIASGVGGGAATLNGTVNPQGFDVEDCHFQYLTDAQYVANGNSFAGAIETPCAGDPATLDDGNAPLPVHADLSGLVAADRYRFRLIAENEHGESVGEPGLFGPPSVSARPALPVLYDEATLRAELDPSGLETEYRFEYGIGESFDQSTPVAVLPPGDGVISIEARLTGLREGTEYRFRLVAENEAMEVVGAELAFETLRRAVPQQCPNQEYRTGRSATLPDCRAYELVTPADTGGKEVRAAPESVFSNWLVAPFGDHAGKRLTFFVPGTLPGFAGNGDLDGYRAEREAGDHPAGGWRIALYGPSYAEAHPSPQTFGGGPTQHGVAADQEHSLWSVNSADGTLDPGLYLRTPGGFEPLGQGSLGTHLKAVPHYVSPGGAHAVFSSDAHLESQAPPAGTRAIYERAAGSSSAQVVSMAPGNVPFGAGEHATYRGSTEDGAAIAFEVASALFLRRAGQTLRIAQAPNTFAGIGSDGERVFFADEVLTGQVPPAAGLYMCEVSAGPCAGAGGHAPAQIAPNARFVNVAADGSRIYFTSTDVLDENLEGSAGLNNLYLWEADSETTRFVALLHPEDLSPDGFLGQGDNLVRWTDALGPLGRALSPARSNADGSVLVFQSHAQLGAYDNTESVADACGDAKFSGDRCAQVYRYDSEAAVGEEFDCVSCDPTNAPAGGDALLQDFHISSPARITTFIPNVTADGEAVFFQTPDPILPEDANNVLDVYTWRDQGSGNCTQARGCLALISSGQGEANSYLYSMTPDGSDVFFKTSERLVTADIPGSPSIYDARVAGGIPDPPVQAGCQGDACQGEGQIGSSAPPLANPGSELPQKKAKPKRPRCRKGTRRVVRRGKVRCVKRRSTNGTKRPAHRRSSSRKGASR